MAHPIEIRKTEEGSLTCYSLLFGEHFHSLKGAVQESQFIYIHYGLEFFLKNSNKKQIHILEMGFGTGLNVLLTSLFTTDRDIFYTSVDAYPLEKEQLNQLNYPDYFPDQKKTAQVYQKIIDAPWDQEVEIHKHFRLKKVHQKLEFFFDPTPFDVIYYDAFSPERQPSLWSEETFEHIKKMCAPFAVLVTYSSKVTVRKALSKVGFISEKLPGPPAKREVTRAVLGKDSGNSMSFPPACRQTGKL